MIIKKTDVKSRAAAIMTANRNSLDQSRAASVSASQSIQSLDDRNVGPIYRLSSIAASCTHHASPDISTAS